ncbi:hypothetical protein [Burkholderia cepacia]|uniref:hypothetical protein n=1 Tax=Burkholderia cepacia TaxID=292 RepID=UPI0012D8F50E|nr:hypothetical protein [Burkholderia cepacia]
MAAAREAALEVSGGGMARVDPKKSDTFTFRTPTALIACLRSPALSTRTPQGGVPRIVGGHPGGSPSNRSCRANTILISRPGAMFPAPGACLFDGGVFERRSLISRNSGAGRHPMLGVPTWWPASTRPAAREGHDERILAGGERRRRVAHGLV